MMGQIWKRVQLLFAVGVTVMVAKKAQVRILDEETLPNIDHVQPYGLSYKPKGGSQAYLLFPAGDRSNGFAIVIGDKRYQMTLADGEVALHDDEGNRVHLKRGGIVNIKANNVLSLDAPNIQFKGNFSADSGSFTVNGKNMSETHTHTCSCGGTGGVN